MICGFIKAYSANQFLLRFHLKEPSAVAKPGGCPIQARFWLEWGSFCTSHTRSPGAHVLKRAPSRPGKPVSKGRHFCIQIRHKRPAVFVRILSTTVRD
jgi:hypothetical protein